MTAHGQKNMVKQAMKKVINTRLMPLDLLPYSSLVEKLVDLVLHGVPSGPWPVTDGLAQLAKAIDSQDSRPLKVVVFGGGTGLSNVIGGDSRTDEWPRKPFCGIKELFPHTTSVVCITDDGGSTGELLKDLPIIGLGDLRHVLLASLQENILQERYRFGEQQCLEVAEVLHRLFNFRFDKRPDSFETLSKAANLKILPEEMQGFFYRLLSVLFSETSLNRLLERQHCLGNLLLVAAIFLAEEKPAKEVYNQSSSAAITKGIAMMAHAIGAEPQAVLPCTTTPAQLKILYANGVLVTGEYKSSHAHRNCPVDRVFAEFAEMPLLPQGVVDRIKAADLILFAPGSLYTSIIPVLQVPGIADAIRDNRRAVKILVANLWAQRGETDLVSDDPKRRFYVSDLIRAYEKNIPGGLGGLFRQVLVLALQDIKGSVIQNYAVEGKVPIYLDREQVVRLGFMPIEARIFSEQAMASRNVLQHDPGALSRAVHAIFHSRQLWNGEDNSPLFPAGKPYKPLINRQGFSPTMRFARITERMTDISCSKKIMPRLFDILWRHFDILPEHLDYIAGVKRVAREKWRRSQEWDKIYAFYDPQDLFIKIRQDVEPESDRFEIGFLVALGQSLLGNYAERKEMLPARQNGEVLGKIFMLTVRKDPERSCFLTLPELDDYLQLARMVAASHKSLFYTRLINGDEGFTPPGLLFGLTYAWYLDNRFAPHVEYKMSIHRTLLSDLIPEQLRTMERRQRMIGFFREMVFKHQIPLF
jgi:uncharacterized cofD-like protein